MKEYPKINSIFMRDQRGKMLFDEYAEPEFEYLKDLPWVWTEKIDGTNIRIMGDGLSINYGGRTEEALIPNKLVNWLNANIHPKQIEEVFGTNNFCLYGEGYGAGIQKGGGNYSQEQKFILFDVKVGDWWLKRPDIEDVATKLGLDVVTVIGEYSLIKVVDLLKMGAKTSPQFPLQNMEGLVGTPKVPLFNRKGERIITKIKYKDFR